MVKKTKYKEIADKIDSGAAYVQAANALDVAAFIAEENREVESLISIAQTYIAIGERLSPHHDDEEEEGRQPFGFSTDAVSDTVIEIEYEEHELEDEDEPQD